MSKRSHGFRSNLELSVAASLNKKKVKYEYEEHKLTYVLAPKTYTPDFYLTKQKFFLEAKGRFFSTDRTKHLRVREQNPDVDLRFVFSNANNKLYKGSKTTYGEWCDRHGFLWSDKGVVPGEWLR